MNQWGEYPCPTRTPSLEKEIVLNTDGRTPATMRLLGPTGLRIFPIALGALTLWRQGDGYDGASNEALFSRWFEAGGNLIDTAPTYGERADGRSVRNSEEWLGHRIAGRRDRFVVATKYSLSTDMANPVRTGSHAKHLLHSVDESLRALRTDYIDLLFVHAWDKFTPLEATLGTLGRLVQAGKILHYGFSNTPAWVVSAADARARERGWEPVSAIQVKWNAMEREAERELVPMAESLGLAVFAWAPLAGGYLSGKYAASGEPDTARDGGARASSLDTQQLETIRLVIEIARSRGVAPVTLALAWLLARSPNAVPVVGARSVSQIEEALAGARFSLTQEELAILEGSPTLGYPHDFLRQEPILRLLHGSAGAPRRPMLGVQGL